MAVHGPARPTYPGQKLPSFSWDLALSELSRWACGRRGQLGGLGHGSAWSPAPRPPGCPGPGHLSPDPKDASAPNPSQGHKLTSEQRTRAGTHWVTGTRRQRAHAP